MTRIPLQLLIDLPPVADALLKATLILALGWALHFALARRNPRWRLLLWRAVAVSVLLTPFLALLMPALKLSVPRPESPAFVMPEPENIGPLIEQQTIPAQMTAPFPSPAQPPSVRVTRHPPGARLRRGHRVRGRREHSRSRVRAASMSRMFDTGRRAS